jgi:hypothetical protein
MMTTSLLYKSPSGGLLQQQMHQTGLIPPLVQTLPPLHPIKQHRCHHHHCRHHCRCLCRHQPECNYCWESTKGVLQPAHCNDEKSTASCPHHQPKIVIQSRQHKESINLAKLQMSMLKLMYSFGNINWEDRTVKNIHLATFAQGFKNLLDRSAMVQTTQQANLFTTVFTTKSDDDDNETHLNPLNRLMGLSIFPQINTKAHLNASFQIVDLEVSLIFKSNLIHPFHYAPQTNCSLVKVV